MRLPALLPAHARCGAQRRGPNLYVNCHFDMKKEQGQAAGGLGGAHMVYKRVQQSQHALPNRDKKGAVC